MAEGCILFGVSTDGLCDLGGQFHPSLSFKSHSISKKASGLFTGLEPALVRFLKTRTTNKKPETKQKTRMIGLYSTQTLLHPRPGSTPNLGP